MTASHNTPGESQVTLADKVAETVLEHPSVLRLHGGEFGVIASHLPGRRVTGVRANEPGEPVEVSVTLLLEGRPLPEITSELRQRVESVAGAVAVDITVSEVVTSAERDEDVDAETGW